MSDIPQKTDSDKNKTHEFLCYLNQNRLKVLLGIGVFVILIVIFIGFYNNKRDDTAANEAARLQRAQDTFYTLTYLCDRMDQLPQQLSEAIGLGEEKKILLGSAVTTTTLVNIFLPEDTQERIREIDKRIAEILKNIGAPTDCKIPELSGVTTTTSKP